MAKYSEYCHSSFLLSENKAIFVLISEKVTMDPIRRTWRYDDLGEDAL